MVTNEYMSRCHIDKNSICFTKVVSTSFNKAASPEDRISATSQLVSAFLKRSKMSNVEDSINSTFNEDSSISEISNVYRIATITSRVGDSTRSITNVADTLSSIFGVEDCISNLQG